ncbi:MAG: hypothetical protein OSJ45_10585 [Lachnospiraceae bacterium]|nr:hypothetical protein [Lachnospiraceae bacterium]
MEKIIKRILSVLLLLVLITSYAGQNAQAAGIVPYGTYKCNKKGYDGVKYKMTLEWQFTSDSGDDFINILCDGERIITEALDKVGKNKYYLVDEADYDHYLILKVYKNRVVMKEKGRNGYNYFVKGIKFNMTFKLKKRLDLNKVS